MSKIRADQPRPRPLLGWPLLVSLAGLVNFGLQSVEVIPLLLNET